MFRKVAYLSLSLIVLLPVAHSQTDSLSVDDSLFVAPLSMLSARDSSKTEYPWTVRSFSSDDISRFPFRGIENYLPLLPGVVQVNNELHLRGSRSNEAGYFIDGIDVTNPMFGSNGVPLIPEAMEALEVHTGPYGTSMGSYNGGIVMSRMKKGGERLSITVNIQSDKFRSPGQQFLNTTVQGYENVVGTISGPLPLLDIRFFLAGQRTTFANRQTMFLEPFRYENLVDDGYWRYTSAGKPLPGPVSFDRNWIPGNGSELSVVQGNVSTNLFGVTLSAMGSYEESELPIGSEWPSALTKYFNQSRNMISRTKTEFGAVEATYAYSDLVSATISYSFYDRFSKTFDPIFKDNWMSYPDIVANARFFNTSQWTGRYYGPDPISTIYALRFDTPGTPNNRYSKSRQTQSRWAIDLLSRPSASLEIRAGGSIESWTMRSFSVGNIRNLLSFLDYEYPVGYDGITSVVFANEYEKRIRYLDQGSISNYGYSFLGNQTDGMKLPGGRDALLDPPYRPKFGSAYLEGLIRSDDMTLHAGVRYQYYDPEFVTVADPLKTATTSMGSYNVALGIIDESIMIPSEAMSLLLPRINVRMTPSDNTAIHAGYGQFAQMPGLDPLYYSRYSFSRRIAAEDRSPYGGDVSFDVKPERSEQFEISLEHVASSALTARIGTYYKTLSNQIQFTSFNDTQGNRLFTQYRNDGNGVAKGVEIECDLFFTPEFLAKISYEYATAKGISSSPRSNRVLFSDQTFPPTPITLRPFDYQQNHRATLVLQARTQDENPIFSNIEATAVLTARSGHAYTRQTEIQTWGANAWMVGVYVILDPRFANPVEAHNASTTPFTTNLDLRFAKTFNFDVAAATLFLQILNVFNTKNVNNVYPTTGTPNDDSWLYSQISEYARQFLNYESFYRDINLNNRWAYMTATGYDIYGAPRSIQFGVNVKLGGSP